MHLLTIRKQRNPNAISMLLPHNMMLIVTPSRPYCTVLTAH